MQRHNFDARRAPRHIAKVRVLYFSKGEPRAVEADCQNISTEGLFVKTRRRGPDAGTPVSLLLQFDGMQKELMVEGVVRWQGAVRSLEDGTEGAGMGIQFTEMDPTVREALERTLDRIEGH
ncbi:MAG: PilZ domain-containing protein [Vicinamibacteria bacterium]